MSSHRVRPTTGRVPRRTLPSWSAAALVVLATAACDHHREIVGRTAPVLTRACTAPPANSTGGAETSTDGGSTWSTCQGYACVDRYQLAGSACAPIPQTRACVTQPANSSGGAETSLDGGQTWSACEGYACLDHYQLAGTACAPRSYTLTILPPVHGSIAGATTGTAYPYGTTIDLTAQTDPTYGVRGWTGHAAPCAAATTCRITMDGDKTVGVHVGKAPVGFGADVTGGEGGAVVTVTTGLELEAALCDSVVSGRCADATPRIVQLPSVIDFRGGGTATSRGCVYADSGCTRNGKTEEILDRESFCAGKTLYDITYDAAGTSPLRVGSNKTLVGIGTGAAIRGKGLVLAGGASNIIVRNLSITDINEGIIWAGDGITLDGVSRVWIDHVYLARIGRALIVSGFGTAAGVTISNSVLDGATACGHYCDGRHYWNALLLGDGQTVTFIGNELRSTSGDAPQLGKGPSAASGGFVHVVNNSWVGSGNRGVVASDDAIGLFEGNAFADAASFTPVFLSSASNPVFAPLEAALATANPDCQRVLGRSCAGNRATGATGGFILNPAVMPRIEATPAWIAALGGFTPLDPALVPSAVGATAGPVEDPDA